MATLLIILLGTMLIQGSSLARSPRVSLVRGQMQHDFAGARHTLLTLTLASLWGWISRQLVGYLHSEWMLTPMVLAGTALIVAVSHQVLKRHNDQPIAPRIDPPINLSTELTTHGASLGMALFCATNTLSWIQTLVCGAGSAMALAGLSACFNALRDRMMLTPVPLGFRGIPIALITAGFMALALMGFAGMVRQ